MAKKEVPRLYLGVKGLTQVLLHRERPPLGSESEQANGREKELLRKTRKKEMREHSGSLEMNSWF